MTSLRASLIIHAALLVIVVVTAVVSAIWLLLLADWRVLAHRISWILGLLLLLWRVLGPAVLALVVQAFVLYLRFLLGLRAAGASPSAVRRAYVQVGLGDAVLTAAGAAAVMWLLVGHATPANAVPLVLLWYAVATGPSTWLGYDAQRTAGPGMDGPSIFSLLLEHLAYLAAATGYLILRMSVHTAMLLLAGTILAYKVYTLIGLVCAFRASQRRLDHGEPP